MGLETSREEDEPALVSAADSAGSAMLVLGRDGDQARAGRDHSYNRINSIGSRIIACPHCVRQQSRRLSAAALQEDLA
jgi:hypothetical protein